MTTQGAFVLYQNFSKALGYTPYSTDFFTPVTVSESFSGTSDAKAGIPLTAPDAITLYRYKGDDTYQVKCGDTPPKTGFYDMEKLKTRDGYGVFFGGNYGLLEISQATDKRPVLLVIKDSYANALLPFLALHYHLLVIDPRYNPPPITDVWKNANAILVLCGEGTLSNNFFENIL